MYRKISFYCKYFLKYEVARVNDNQNVALTLSFTPRSLLPVLNLYIVVIEYRANISSSQVHTIWGQHRPFRGPYGPFRIHIMST